MLFSHGGMPRVAVGLCEMTARDGSDDSLQSPIFLRKAHRLGVMFHGLIDVRYGDCHMIDADDPAIGTLILRHRALYCE